MKTVRVPDARASRLLFQHSLEMGMDETRMVLRRFKLTYLPRLRVSA